MDAAAPNVLLIESECVARRILNPTFNTSVPPSFPIQVDEPAHTATVQAGVPQRIFLDYLAAYKCAQAGTGDPVQAVWINTQKLAADTCSTLIPSTAGHAHIMQEVDCGMGDCSSTALCSLRKPLLDLLPPAQCGRWGSLSQDRQGAAGLYPDRAHCCRTAKAPLGYTLPAFPWYIDQTVGGAVATGTHGSSLQFGSLSSQVRPPALRCSSHVRHFHTRSSSF